MARVHRKFRTQENGDAISKIQTVENSVGEKQPHFLTK
jgi:hypothetical protein